MSGDSSTNTGNKPPCGCIELTEGGYIQRCDCSNAGDLSDAQAWCTEQNTAAPLLLLINRAVGVLRSHAPPDGLSDHDAMTEMYAIFDGEEYRKAVGSV